MGMHIGSIWQIRLNDYAWLCVAARSRSVTKGGDAACSNIPKVVLTIMKTGRHFTANTKND